MQRLWRPALPGGIHVCGCGHSGTSILTRLIGAHPRIHAIPGESGVAKKESYRRYRQALEGFWADTSAAGAASWVEKTPKHVRHLAFILNAAPSSRIVLICRDPRDCVASLKRRYGRFGKALRRWRHDNGRVLRWRTHPQVSLLRYEDLVRDPQATLEELMPRLGLAFDPSQLQYHRQEVSWYGGHRGGGGGSLGADGGATQREPTQGQPSEHRQLRNQQINQPLFNASGRFADQLTPVEIALVHRRCTRLARRLGYSLV
jgi:hypothetical protein